MTYTKELKRTRASFDAANQLKILAASNEEVSVRQTVAPFGTRHAMASHTDPTIRNSPPYSSHHQLEDDQAESLVAAALREDRRNISDAWDSADNEAISAALRSRHSLPVSYTHLTLPTNREV